LPKALRGRRPTTTKPNLRLFLLIGVIVLGLIASVLLGLIKIPGIEGFTFGFTKTQTPSILVPTLTAVIPEPTTTSTSTQVVLPTETKMVIAPTDVSPHFLETPIGENPQLLIHRLKEGDGYIYLAQIHTTTENAIKAINYNLPDSLQVGKILIIPVNTSVVEGLPQFSAYEILESGTTIEELADLLKLDEDLLEKYNSLPGGYTFEKGEWLLIPH